MNKEKTESSFTDKYPIKKANEMSVDEEAKWIALCNALKFINHTSQTSGIVIKEKDIHHSDLLTYINNVSGDIKTCITEKGGVPFKYSLSSASEEAKITDELTYEFLTQ